jgi:beta-hydroxyacyl-ACP dehydratase FabZ
MEILMASSDTIRRIDQIMNILPHRYPFLLIDRILEVEDNSKITGLKNVTINEPFFPGHFPGLPIMPGVLIIEAMAQLGGAFLLEHEKERDKKWVFFTGIDEARFRRPVRPGDQLIMVVSVIKRRQTTCKMRGEAYVDGQLVAEAELLSAIIDR